MQTLRRQEARNARRTPSLLLLALVLSSAWAPIALAEAGPRKLLAPTQAPAPAGLAAVVNAAVLPVVNVDLTHGVTASAVAAATASAAIYAVLQSNGILAPIANVAGTVAGAAAVAQLAITPNGTSVVLCAAVADTTVASLRNLGITLPVATKAGAAVAVNLGHLNVCNGAAVVPAPAPPPPRSPDPALVVKVNITLDVALRTATNAVLNELKADNVPLPIAAVGAAAAAAAAVATLTLSPAGVSLTLCAKILAAAVASLKGLGFDPILAAKAGTAIVVALAPLNGCIAASPPPM